MNISEIKKFLKQFLNEVKKSQNIFIFHHVNPDGDCLGSQFALKKWLEIIFPEKKIYAIGNNKGLFPFLEWNFNNELIDSEIESNSLAIMVDGNFLNRINEFEFFNKIPNKIRIDHHPEDDDVDYALRFVDDSYTSSCEQIAHLIYLHNPNLIDQNVAKYIYLGIYTDSGRFFYDKTSPRTHLLTSHLMSTNFDFFELHKNLAKRTIDEIKFNKYVFDKYQTHKNVIYCHLKFNEIKKLNIPEASWNRVDFLANIEGYDIWIFFIENEDGTIRVRLRSSDKDISELARKFNGGGHKKASGAMIENEKDIEKIVHLASEI